MDGCQTWICTDGCTAGCYVVSWKEVDRLRVLESKQDHLRRKTRREMRTKAECIVLFVSHEHQSLLKRLSCGFSTMAPRLWLLHTPLDSTSTRSLPGCQNIVTSASAVSLTRLWTFRRCGWHQKIASKPSRTGIDETEEV